MMTGCFIRLDTAQIDYLAWFISLIVTIEEGFGWQISSHIRAHESIATAAPFRV
jgi:hypothetical protein